VDDNQGVAMRFDVYALPTFIIFIDGKPIDRAVGAVGEGDLEELIQKYAADLGLYNRLYSPIPYR
jgi:thioredoxin